MKTFFGLAIAALLSTAAMAQKYVPQIKTGTVINYTANVKSLGQNFPLTLTVTNLSDPLRLKWNVPQLGTGSFEMSAKALESGNKMGIKEPHADDVTKLKDNETLGVLSKATFTAITTNKTFELNGQTYTVTADPNTDPYLINDKAADIIYAATTNGKNKIWVLNNPDFPLVVRIQSTQMIDFWLDKIVE
jgi:hypothetical protein